MKCSVLSSQITPESFYLCALPSFSSSVRACLSTPLSSSIFIRARFSPAAAPLFLSSLKIAIWNGRKGWKAEGWLWLFTWTDQRNHNQVWLFLPPSRHANANRGWLISPSQDTSSACVSLGGRTETMQPGRMTSWRLTLVGGQAIPQTSETRNSIWQTSLCMDISFKP